MAVEKVFLDYDQDALDGQLNLRARWPDHQEIFERWARDSAAVRRRCRCELDVAYGPTEGERMDLFLPEGSGPFAIIAFIHGGYWQSLDKGDFSYLAPAYLDEGIAFASLNYTLAPAATIAAMVGQLRRALVFLHRKAADFGLDEQRLFVAGHSAGGHLATLLTEADWLDRYGLPAKAIKGGCSVSGVYDLAPISLSYHQPIVRIDAKDVEALSPLHSVPRHSAPLICAVGADETEEFLRQQMAVVKAWRAAGHRVNDLVLDDLHHFTVIDTFGRPGHILFDAMTAMVRGA